MAKPANPGQRLQVDMVAPPWQQLISPQAPGQQPQVCLGAALTAWGVPDLQPLAGGLK